MAKGSHRFGSDGVLTVKRALGRGARPTGSLQAASSLAALRSGEPRC